MTVQIITGDCRKALADLQDESVDAIVTDPPYNQTSLQWDNWVDGWPRLVHRVLKRMGSLWCFGNLRMFMDRRDQFSGWRLAQDIVWEKHNGSSFHTDRFRRVHEQAAQFYRDDAKWNEVFRGEVVTNDATSRTVRRRAGPVHMGSINEGSYRSEDGGPRIMRSVIYARSEHGRAVHPTQKPVAIVEPLILNACPPGGLVLDPFAGSGTTGIAAKITGRRAILIEADPEMADIARRRIADDAPLLTNVT